MTRLSTHRLLQIHNLYDISSHKAVSNRKAASNLSRINNIKGESYMIAKAEQWERIASKCKTRLDFDGAHAARDYWMELARGYDDLAQTYEDRGHPFGVGCAETQRFLAEQARRAAKSIQVWIDTGAEVCSCCFKPIGTRQCRYSEAAHV